MVAFPMVGNWEHTDVGSWFPSLMMAVSSPFLLEGPSSHLNTKSKGRLGVPAGASEADIHAAP